MQQRQINKPISVNLDKSKKYLTPTEAFYMLNRERNINGTGTLGKTTPLVANYLACMIDQPEGDNYTTGHCFSELTNELYWFTYNSNGVNYVARINGDGTCEIVYDGECLPLSAAPEHAIEEWRCYLKYDRFCAHQHGKQLIWTDGENPIGQLDVEASIATNSFTTAFFETCPDPCAYTQMCVPEPCGALEGEFVTLDVSEADLNNHLVDVGFKVRFRHIYYDQRKSEWSDISTLYFQDSRGCFDASEGFPRCMTFRLPVGNPMVDKIEFAISTDNGINWKSVDVIEKYQPYSSTAQYWYERELADLTGFSDEDCAFDYVFCNDKQCNPIPLIETVRTFNPIPRKAQGLIRIKDSLGFYNYVKGNCPIDGSEALKFEITPDCTDEGCAEEFATVTAFALIHNPLTYRNGLVFRVQGTSTSDPDDPEDKARFASSFNPAATDQYQQYFNGEIRNFIAYVEGTNYWAQMEQYKSDDGFNSKIKVGVVSGMDSIDARNQVFGEISGGNFYYQQYTLKVPKGTKGFIRLANQLETNGLPSEGQDTSTYVTGTIPDIRTYDSIADLNGILSDSEELYFDTCDGDVTLYETLVVHDNYRTFQNGSHSSSAYAGFLTDANNVPVENADIYYNGSRYGRTDHNGFYHFTVYGDPNTQTIQVQVMVETGCVGGFNIVKYVTLFGGYNRIVNMNIQISDVDAPGYKDDFYSIVNVALKDCDNEPLGGVRIALSGSKYQVTDAITGIATFNIRNNSSRNRSVRGVAMDINNCFTLDCSDECNPCLPSTANTATNACYSGKPVLDIATTENINKDPAFANKKGLKAGGRYPFGIVAKGGCGQVSAVYPVTTLNGSLVNLDNYINIPKTQEKGSLSFCSFEYDANGMVLPDWAECLAIVRGENVNNYELQWVIDKIERTADRKIKLTIQSLNDYNARYNFETNTLYQYIKGDRVEFINNGNGDIFDIATYGLLNYQILSPYHDVIVSGEDEAPAEFFNQILIDDDGSLDDLTVGAKIELQRPKNCTVEPTYFEIANLPVIEISGQKVLATPSGTFTTFDTYLVTRQIEASNLLEGNPPQRFEHKFPSDFWGHTLVDGQYLGLSDIGKVHFTNKFENEKRYGRNITINSANQFNRFGDLEKTLDAPEQGDIIAMAIYDGKIGLGVGEFDSFLFQVSDEFLRVGSNGLVQAAPPDSLVSDTQPKVSGIFGCRYDSIGSIYFGDGFATWVDTGKSAHVKHDFNIAIDMSEGKYNMWVKKTVQYMQNFNATAATDPEKLRFASGFNFHTKALQLSVKALNQGGVNNEQQPYINYRSTILVEPRSEELLTFASYTPEAYSRIVLKNSTGCAFVTFLNGIPYIHPIIPIKYNEFFGTAVDSIVGISIHYETADKEINPLSMEIQDETMWFASKVSVDNADFESEIPPIRWKKKMDKWNGEFLCDKNSRGGLYGNDPRTAGKKPRGYFCAVTLIRDNTNSNIYNSVNDAKRVLFDELDLIISKASIAEQSGFTGNL